MRFEIATMTPAPSPTSTTPSAVGRMSAAGALYADAGVPRETGGRSLRHRQPEEGADRREDQGHQQAGLHGRSELPPIPQVAGSRGDEEDRRHEWKYGVGIHSKSGHLAEPALLSPGRRSDAKQRGSGLQQTEVSGGGTPLALEAFAQHAAASLGADWLAHEVT